MSWCNMCYHWGGQDGCNLGHKEVDHLDGNCEGFLSRLRGLMVKSGFVVVGDVAGFATGKVKGPAYIFDQRGGDHWSLVKRANKRGDVWSCNEGSSWECGSMCCPDTPVYGPGK